MPLIVSWNTGECSVCGWGWAGTASNPNTLQETGLKETLARFQGNVHRRTQPGVGDLCSSYFTLRRSRASLYFLFPPTKKSPVCPTGPYASSLKGNNPTPHLMFRIQLFLYFSTSSASCISPYSIPNAMISLTALKEQLLYVAFRKLTHWRG